MRSIFRKKNLKEEEGGKDLRQRWKKKNKPQEEVRCKEERVVSEGERRKDERWMEEDFRND